MYSFYHYVICSIHLCNEFLFNVKFAYVLLLPINVIFIIEYAHFS